MSGQAGAPMTGQPALMVDPDPVSGGSCGVRVDRLDPDAMRALDEYLRAGGPLHAILIVAIVRAEASAADRVPDVSGRHEIVEDGIRFAPHFPFERGLSYRAAFDPRPLGHPQLADVLTLQFSLPREQSATPTKVERIYPSSDALPENLLRFYVCFSNPMQRGRVRDEISLLGPDGEPAPDVLYRAPVELWDRSMTRLTLLLDPGRLKRGVGPNRQLGPPLKVGRVYTLAIGAGMTDLSGRQLAETVYKRFSVTEAIREPIAIERWRIQPPMTDSRSPLTLLFPRPLDWALLSHGVVVASTCERSVSGRIAIDRLEQRWSFTPTRTWTAGSYHVRVAPTLEDVCGNSVVAAFDRPLRASSDLECEATTYPIPFRLEV